MLGNVLTAIVTPFRDDDSIDFDAFQRLAGHLVENGSDGIVVAGTTGESPNLTDEERLDLVRALRVPDRARTRPRRRRLPRRDAVLQQAAAARRRRALRDDRARQRQAD